MLHDYKKTAPTDTSVLCSTRVALAPMGKGSCKNSSMDKHLLDLLLFTFPDKSPWQTCPDHGFSQSWEEVCTAEPPPVVGEKRSGDSREEPRHCREPWPEDSPAWKLSSSLTALAPVLRFPPRLCQLLYKEDNCVLDTHILVRFLSKMTIQFNGSTARATAWKFFH